MNLRRRPRAVVFDLDGTVIDSMPLVLAAVSHAIEPHGTRTPDEIFARLGGPPERFLGDLLPDARHVPEAVARLHAYHRENGHQIRVFEGAVALFESLHRSGVAAALWTGRDRTSTEVLIGRHALHAHFRTVVCGDDLPTHKPDPAGLREIMRRLDVDPVDTLLVGDADVDVLGGAEVGVDTLLIHHGRAIADGVRRRAWRVVDFPENAFHLVKRCLEAGG